MATNRMFYDRLDDMNPDGDNSILSDRADGFGFFYGFCGNDRRQINVRQETNPNRHKEGGGPEKMWHVYVGGSPIGWFEKFNDAERAAVEWVKNVAEY